MSPFRACVSAWMVSVCACSDAGPGAPNSESDATGESDTGSSESDTSETDTGPVDACPDDPDKEDPGQCGCGEIDTDGDLDGFADCVDTCLVYPNTDQADSDGDGLGDGCDPCPHDDDAACECPKTSASACAEGMAGPWPCQAVDLLHFRSESEFGAEQSNDVWGWTDPATDREYALVGLDMGVSFVDVTDPSCTRLLGLLPTHSVPNGWRDMKVHENLMYTVSEAEEHGLQIFDLLELTMVTDAPVVFEETAHHDGFAQGHNIAINSEVATAYVFGGDQCEEGIYMLDLADPLDPQFVGCYDAVTVHDAQCLTYAGPDLDHQGKQLCITANGRDESIGVVDVTDPANPIELSRVMYEGAYFAHQGWLTEDETYFLLGDEADELAGVNTTTFIWDMTDLDAPMLMGSHVAETQATDHNLFVRDGLLYQGNYNAGLRVLDLAEVAAVTLTEIAYFDTFPEHDDAGFGSTWGIYPFFASGKILVTSEGLFVVEINL